jgi:hypothetical protein
MDSGHRFFLVFSLSVAFIIFGFGAVFYAQGWRIDFKTLKPIKVGAIYVKSHPSKAQIFLDYKSIKRGFSLFDSGVLINGLFPKKYLLEIKMPGYKEWKRHIEVLPSLVSEVKYAVLVPENSLEFNNINFPTSTLFSFLIGPDNNFIFLDNQNNIFYNKQTISNSKIIDTKEDLSAILTYDLKNKNYFLWDLEKSTSTNLSSVFKKISPNFTFENINFSKDYENELLLWDSKKISTFDISKNKINIIATSTMALAPQTSKISITTVFSTSSLPIINALSSKMWLIWVEYDTNKNISNLKILQRILSTQKINLVSLPFKNEKILMKNNTLFILQSDGSLYKYDLMSQKLNSLASDVRNFYLNDDATMLLAQESNAFEIFNLKDSTDYWRFNMPDSKDIIKISWFKDSRNIFLHYKDRVLFLELDDSKKENIKVIALTNYGEYDKKTNRFYFIEQNKVKFIEFKD